jgi:chromosome segregation ATPase
MASLDITPVVVALISAGGAVLAAIYSFRNGKKTNRKIETLPNDLVAGFTKLNPGVDTVEKVVDLLYAEINRLTDDNTKLRKRIDILVAEKQELLDEIRKMQQTLDHQKRQLRMLEARIKKSIPR